MGELFTRCFICQTIKKKQHQMSNHVTKKLTTLIKTNSPWTTSPGFLLPIYPFPRHMLQVRRSILCLLRTAHQPWLEYGEVQFGRHLFYPFLSEALGTWNSSVLLTHSVAQLYATPILVDWTMVTRTDPLCIWNLHCSCECSSEISLTMTIITSGTLLQNTQLFYIMIKWQKRKTKGP